MNGIVGVINPSRRQREMVTGYFAGKHPGVYDQDDCIIAVYDGADTVGQAQVYRELAPYTDLVIFGNICSGQAGCEPSSEGLLSALYAGSLSGEFAAIVIDRRQNSIRLFTEGNYVTPLYYSRQGQTLAFSTLMPWVHQLVGSPRVLWGKAVHDFLAYGNCLGSDTFFEEIKILGANQQLQFNGSIVQLATAAPANRGGLYTSVQTAQEDLIKAFTGAIQSRLTTGRVGVSMSGGMDSRFMLALMDKYFPEIDLCAYMWAQPFSHEMAVTREVCAVAGVPLTEYLLSPGDFIQQYEECCAIHGGNDYFFQGFMYDMGARLQGAGRQMLTGYCLDLTLGASFMWEGLEVGHKISTRTLEEKRGKLKAAVFSSGDFDKALRSGAHRQYVNSYYEEFEKFEGENTFGQIQDFLLANRVMHLVVNRDTVPRQFVKYAYPSVDKSVRSIMDRIPCEWKMNHCFYRELFIKEFPRLASVEYFNTGLPVAAPLPLWQQGRELLSRQEALANEVFNQSGRTLFYKHYYSNFDQWLAGEPAWIRDAKNILYDDDAGIYATLFQPQYVRGLYEQHVSGKANQRKKLTAILTLEKIMRFYGVQAVDAL